VVEVALSGNLGFVPLNEVLRLLARAGQKGAVEVRGEDIRGRVFVTKRGVTLATTSTDSELRSHLINSEFVDHEYLRDVETGSATLETAADRDPGLVQLLREMSVESLYQMTSRGATFEVDENAESAYASPKPFDLEGLLDDAERRHNEWAEVTEILSDMAGVIRMKRDLGSRDEVTVTRDAWKLLSELGSGSSVGELAGRLGTTDFWTAKVAAEMAGRELLTIEEGSQASAAAYEEPAESPWAPSPEPTPAEPEGQAEVSSDADEDVDPDRSWWVEPAADEESEDAAAEFETSHETEPGEPEDAESEANKGGRLGVFALNRDQNEGASLGYLGERGFEDVEEDTEAFLEKVFSELEQPEPEAEAEAETAAEPEPEGEGHGLLRRRRLGSLLQETQAKDD
jgi:hypothetical protein